MCVFFGHTFMNPQSRAPRRQDFQSEASRSSGIKNGPIGLLLRESYLVIKPAISMVMASISQIHLHTPFSLLLFAPFVPS